MTKNIKTPKRVLCVVAHPDDADFGASGTVAKWASRGAAVFYLICTDGSKGSEDPKMTRKKLSRLRQKEQREAAKVLGVKSVQFLNHPDGELVADLKLKEEISKVIRETQPDVVITTDPTFVYSTKTNRINHSDHRAAGQAALDAVFPLARDRLNFPHHERAGLKAHKVKTLLLNAFENPEHFEDITKTMENKIAALKAHESQVPESPRLEQLLKKRASAIGKKARMKYAEGFKKIELS